jgi:glycosyltransferase involved in cell wall biosynthesis
MQMGHHVCVVSPPSNRVPYSTKLKSWLKGHGWPDDLARRRSHLDGVEFDHRVLDRWRPITDDDVPDGDVVIATWWETAEWVAALSAVKGVKVHFIQGHEVYDYLPKARTRAAYRLPFHKIVVSEWLQQVMRREYSDSVVDLVPNSFDRTQFFASIRGKHPTASVGFLYHVSPLKGLDVTLAALQIVRRRISSLQMISFGSERPNGTLRLPKGVEFFYLPPQDAIRNLYASCDAWVTASRSEGFNLPALEAMACRTPIVSTRTGWPADTIKSGWNGVLVDVDDVGRLAQGIEWVLTRSDDEWRTLSANAYATASAGSWEESAKLFEKALEHARIRATRGEILGGC